MALRLPHSTRTQWSIVFAWSIVSLAFGAGALKAQDLPDAPSTLLDFADLSGEQSQQTMPQLPVPKPLPPCDKVNQATSIGPRAERPVQGEKRGQPCIQENPLQPIVSAKDLPALSSQEKGKLAARDIVDPFNLFTIGAYSGIVIASNAHTAYGPGWKGFGKLTGYSFLEDTQGEFFGTFAIPSLAHQDPRYYRMPGQPVARRLLHAIGHTVVTRHDDGSPMPNYATLLTYPISAELSNLYVPGIAVNAPSTTKRIGLGLATDPVGAIVAEFLPDVARRIHIRVVFVQQILQQVVAGAPSVSSGP
jgi:hypothetical protein